MRRLMQNKSFFFNLLSPRKQIVPLGFKIFFSSTRYHYKEFLFVIYITIELVEYFKYNHQKTQRLPADYSSSIIQMYVMLDMEIFTLSKFLFMANCSYEYQHIL